MSALSESKRRLTRVSRACQECRKRKVRCSFESPCGTCRQHNIPCVYREFARQRKRIGESRAISSATNDEAGEGETGDNSHTDGPSRIYINTPHALFGSKGVSACAITNTTVPMELFYGSSCSFSFLEQLHRDLRSIHRSASSDTNDEDIQDARVIIGEYNFRNLFFGSRQVSDTTSVLPCLLLLASISQETAASFLDSFLTTNYPLCPVEPEEDFFTFFELFVGKGLDENVLEYRAYLLMIALALGALNLGDHEWRDRLLEEVERALKASAEVVNVEIIQCHLLLAHLLAEKGDFNSAYLAIGITVRKAIAGGLHNNLKGPRLESNRRAIWAIYYFEGWLSHTLGRPASLPYSLIDQELPSSTDLPLLLSLVEFSKTLETHNTKLDRPRRGHILEIWEDAQAAYESLQVLKHRLEERFEFQMTDSHPVTEMSSSQITVTTYYNHILYSTFRPFLIIERRWRNHLMRLNPAVSQPSSVPRVFVRARRIATQASRKQIVCVSSAMNSEATATLTRAIRHFLEEACFLLIYSLIDSTETEDADIRSIDSAMKTIMESGSKAAFPEFPSIIRKLVTAIVSSERPVESRVAPSGGSGADSLGVFSRLQISLEKRGLAPDDHSQRVVEDPVSRHDNIYSALQSSPGNLGPAHVEPDIGVSLLTEEASSELRADPQWSLDPFLGANSMDIDFSSLWTTEPDSISTTRPN